MNGLPAPSSRNALCPCGSGRRYKDCHGAIGAGRAASTVGATLPGRSAYRPSGPDWAQLSEPERSACGALMELALKEQLAERLTEAAAHYSEVLSRAPNTHDALHMLGAIELRRGNFAEAKKLILAALALRPPYPDIEHNLRMAEDLERAARVGAGRPVASPEALCEKALPILVDLVLRPARRESSQGRSPAAPRASARSVHIISGVRESSDDGWLLRRIAALLAAERPMTWTGGDARARASSPRDRIGGRGDFPDGGCHVFVGIDFDCDEWIERGTAERVVVFCQPAPPSQCLQQLRAISRDGTRPVELVFPSRAMAARFGGGHAVLPPPIASDADLATAEPRFASPALRRFAAGLTGRHWQGTAPGEDAEFLRRLGSAAGTLELYDPGALRYVVGADPAARCRSRSATAMRRFLSSVDCLLHPAGSWWLEGDGRELFMAMAAGVPVICPRSSIFAEYIEHGVDGLLYDRRDEALEHIAALRGSPTLLTGLGRGAHAKVAALAAPERAAGVVRQIVFDDAATAQPAGGGAARVPLAAK
ncbi:MAG TPA: SEC-C metal-binding domain-containing protein [Casimicrobiaceae bacterium]|nr:SEC-C metal-binding domain-containing protein [Casimicrobiaceae bacterium]